MHEGLGSTVRPQTKAANTERIPLDRYRKRSYRMCKGRSVADIAGHPRVTIARQSGVEKEEERRRRARTFEVKPADVELLGISLPSSFHSAEHATPDTDIDAPKIQSFLAYRHQQHAKDHIHLLPQISSPASPKPIDLSTAITLAIRSSVSDPPAYVDVRRCIQC